MTHCDRYLKTYLSIVVCSLPMLASASMAADQQSVAIDSSAQATPVQSFQAERISALESERVVHAANYLEQSAADRPRIDAAFVINSTAQPIWRIRLDQTVVYFGKPFANEDGHRFVLAFVQQNGRIDARIFYRSNSQFSWRVCDATANGHIGKGFHEFDKELPIALTIALHATGHELLALHAPNLRPATSAEVTRMFLRGLTESASAAAPGKVAIAQDGHYWSHDYAAYVASEPLSWSPVNANLPSASGLMQADPGATGLPPPSDLPDVRHPLYEFSYNNEAYAPFAAGQAKVTGRVFMSFNQRLQYLFFSDAAGRVFLSSVELKSAPLTPYGVRATYLDVQGMNAPLMEYSQQIPLRYGGSVTPGYADNWQYVKRQPIVMYYLRELNP